MEPSRFYSKPRENSTFIGQEIPYDSEDEVSSDEDFLYQPNQESDISDNPDSGEFTFQHAQYNFRILCKFFPLY